jgi:hypothetical protein
VRSVVDQRRFLVGQVPPQVLAMPEEAIHRGPQLLPGKRKEAQLSNSGANLLMILTEVA